MKELAKEYDCEFEERHVEVLNFIEAEDTAALESEEAVFNEHVDRIAEIIERIEHLEDLIGTVMLRMVSSIMVPPDHVQQPQTVPRTIHGAADGPPRTVCGAASCPPSHNWFPPQNQCFTLVFIHTTAIR